MAVGDVLEVTEPLPPYPWYSPSSLYQAIDLHQIYNWHKSRLPCAAKASSAVPILFLSSSAALYSPHPAHLFFCRMRTCSGRCWPLTGGGMPAQFFLPSGQNLHTGATCFMAHFQQCAWSCHWQKPS